MTHDAKKNIRSPLAGALGAGAAGSGTGHWMHQRLTALANIPLMLWLVWAVARSGGFTYESFTAWLAAPVNATLMILAVISAFYHAALGVQVIIEDYIHNEALKFAKLVLLRLFFIAAGVLCIVSIMKTAFGG